MNGSAARDFSFAPTAACELYYLFCTDLLPDLSE